MRFRGELIGRIRRGDVTQARRPRRGGKPAPASSGRLYAIQRVDVVEVEGKSESRVSTVEGEFVHVVDVRRQLLHEVTEEEAAAEGFETAYDFWEWFFSAYGEGWGHRGYQPGGYVAEIPIWVVEFKIARDVPRLLARQGGLVHPPQYTRSFTRAIDELEVVEPTGPKWNQKLDLDRRVSWAKEREVISGALDRLMEDPHMRDELGGDLRVLQRRLAAIDRRLHGQEAA